jgi:hypothetical protein
MMERHRRIRRRGRTDMPRYRLRRDGPYELIVEGPTYAEAMRTASLSNKSDWTPLGVAYDECEEFVWDDAAIAWVPLVAGQEASPGTGGSATG